MSAVAVEDRLLTEREVAERYQLSRRTIAAWRQSGKGPRFVDLCGNKRYRESDLVAFEQGSEQ